MLKHKLFSVLTAVAFVLVTAGCQKAEPKNGAANEQSAKEKDEIMHRDQIDPSNVFAIPFDDSEVEDEQEINRDEKKEVFPLPHSH